MQYDPIKRSLGIVFNQSPWLRIVFYRMLDLLLLRTWHVKKALRHWQKDTPPHSLKEIGDSLNSPGKKILDAGSGFGQYTYFLSRMDPGFCIDAVDVKQEQILDCARFFARIEKQNVTFSVADLTAFLKPGTYDLILSVDVMEHILEDEQVFQNFYESLKPGGMVLISTPSDQGGSDVHDHEEESSFIDEHVRDGYGIPDIQNRLKKAGFSSISIHYTYGKPGQMGWKLSMKYPVKMLNVSKIFFLILPFYYILLSPVILICNALDVRLQHKTGTGLLVKAWKS